MIELGVTCGKTLKEAITFYNMWVDAVFLTIIYVAEKGCKNFESLSEKVYECFWLLLYVKYQIYQIVQSRV